MAESDEIELKSDSWFWSLFSWARSSPTMLRTVEKKILSYLKTPYRGWYVDIGKVVGPSDKVWTIALNKNSPKTPIVLLHGLGAGVALWVLNLDALAKQRPVYAIDLLGFGRSSRPVFSKEAHEAEKQLVDSVEEWRKEMQLDKFVLLGHSMGGFLAASYAIRYPERVIHVILADPWGIPERPADMANRIRLPLWVKAIAYVIQPLNPLWAVRFAGPFGQWLIETARPDIVKKFTPVLKEDTSIISQYIHQCNVQTPSGESAFHAMMQGFGWAKNPMIKRIHEIDTDVPITLIYGSRSWVDPAGETVQQVRPSSYVNVQIITGAGHHVYLDKSDIFNRYVLKACSLSERHPKLSSTNVSVRQQELRLVRDEQQQESDQDKLDDKQKSKLVGPESTR